MLRPSTAILDRYRYQCSNIIIAIEGQTDPITIPSDKIQYIDIIKPFDNRIIPYMSLTMQVSKYDYALIQSSIPILSVYMSIDKYKITDSTSVFMEHCIKGSLIAVNEELLDPQLAGQLKNQDPNAEDTIVQDTITMRLFLYNDSKYIRMRIMKSLNMTGSMTDALYYSFGSRSFVDVLMTPLNSDVHDTFNVPTSTLMGTLNHLNVVYGIYNSPYCFFMDFHATYLIDNGRLGVATRPMESGIVSMYIEEYGSKESADVGCYIDDKQIVLNVTKLPIIADVENSIEYMMAAKLTGALSGSNSVSSVVCGTQTLMERALLINNTKILSQEKHLIDENRAPIRLMFIDVDMDIFTPNKSYQMIVHTDYEPKYRLKGSYRLSNCVISLSKDGESGMKCTVQCNMKKQIK